MKISKTYQVPLSLLFCIALWLLLYQFSISALHLGSKESLDATNSIIAALGFGGVVITIFIQQKELSLQVEELKSTRDEFIQQNKTLKKQRFEDTFFSLLSVHNSITEKIFINHNAKDFRSRQAVQLLYLGFRSAFLNAYAANGNPPITRVSIDSHRQLISQKFSEVYGRFEEYFGHYFRNFETLVELVANSDLIDEEERIKYYKIIRSQLNSYEVVVHFYNFNIGYAQHKDFFNYLNLGSILNGSLLLNVEHSYIFDPPHVIEAALSTKENR
jgi:hypothetical protein